MTIIGVSETGFVFLRWVFYIFKVKQNKTKKKSKMKFLLVVVASKKFIYLIGIVGVCSFRTDAQVNVYEGQSKVSRQSTRDVQSDQPSGKSEVNIPDGIFNKPGEQNPEAYDDYERLKNKPDEFDWKLSQVNGWEFFRFKII